jgi:hypothetical protein
MRSEGEGFRGSGVQRFRGKGLEFGVWKSRA